jgi:hypothetical protein
MVFENQQPQMQQPQPGLGQTGQQFIQKAAEADVYDQLKIAQNQFQDSCHRLLQAQQARAASEAQLQQAMERAAKHIQDMASDPTSPQCPPPMNGKLAGRY